MIKEMTSEWGFFFFEWCVVKKKKKKVLSIVFPKEAPINVPSLLHALGKVNISFAGDVGKVRLKQLDKMQIS